MAHRSEHHRRAHSLRERLFSLYFLQGLKKLGFGQASPVEFERAADVPRIVRLRRLTRRVKSAQRLPDYDPHLQDKLNNL